MTSVAAAPMLRIDDTGLPISTSRVSTMPRMGARIVAFRSSSSARSTAARACATLAWASATLARATISWPLALRWRFSATSSALCASSRPDCGDEALVEQAPGADEGPPRELDVGAFGFDDVLLERGFGAAEAGFGGLEVGARLADASREHLLVELGEHLARLRCDHRRRPAAPR